MPNLFKKIKTSKKFRWLLIIASIFLLLAGGSAAAYWFYEINYQDKVFPGITSHDLKLRGLTATQAQAQIDQQIQSLLAPGLRFSYQTNVKAVDATAELLKILSQDMAEQALSLGRDQSPARNWLTRARLLLFGDSLAMKFQLDQFALTQAVQKMFAEFENPARDSDISVKIIDESKKQYELTFTAETNGRQLDYDTGINKLQNHWRDYANPIIELALNEDQAEINQVQAQTMTDAVEKYLKLDAPVFTYNNKKYPVRWAEYINWLTLYRADDRQIKIRLNEQLVRAYLDELGLAIDQPAQNAVLIIKDGRAEEFQMHQTGLGIDRAATYELINQEVIDNQTAAIELIVSETQPEIPLEKTNDLGIKEKLGAGYSNFANSPGNRIKNIRNAAFNKIHGYIIKPDEEFSLLAATRPFTIGGGYLPELVIKGDKIEPEIGGGLCQIGTTMFRAAMNSAMPITQRRNHSLVVSYYNDHRNHNPGTDATIYDPSPDFKFINDTGHHILITAYMNTNNGDLTFTFWGTSDGRQGSYTEPVVLNWIGTGPARNIESSTMAPGQKKCQGSHAGANTTFDYIRKLPTGETETITYDSHYRALPTICLVGPAVEAPGASGGDPSSAAVNEPAAPLADVQAPAAETIPANIE